MKLGWLFSCFKSRTTDTPHEEPSFAPAPQGRLNNTTVQHCESQVEIKQQLDEDFKKALTPHLHRRAIKTKNQVLTIPTAMHHVCLSRNAYPSEVAKEVKLLEDTVELNAVDGFLSLGTLKSSLEISTGHDRTEKAMVFLKSAMLWRTCKIAEKIEDAIVERGFKQVLIYSPTTFPTAIVLAKKYPDVDFFCLSPSNSTRLTLAVIQKEHGIENLIPSHACIAYASHPVGFFTALHINDYDSELPTYGVIEGLGHYIDVNQMIQTLLGNNDGNVVLFDVLDDDALTDNEFNSTEDMAPSYFENLKHKLKPYPLISLDIESCKEKLNCESVDPALTEMHELWESDNLDLSLTQNKAFPIRLLETKPK